MELKAGRVIRMGTNSDKKKDEENGLHEELADDEIMHEPREETQTLNIESRNQDIIRDDPCRWIICYAIVFSLLSKFP